MVVDSVNDFRFDFYLGYFRFEEEIQLEVFRVLGLSLEGWVCFKSQIDSFWFVLCFCEKQRIFFFQSYGFVLNKVKCLNN